MEVDQEYNGRQIGKLKSRYDLTQKMLSDRLHYDPRSGQFAWRVSRGTQKKGSVAGFVKEDGSRVISLCGHRYRASHLAWFYITGKWAEHEIDHINRDRRDDSWKNLRAATRSQNQANVGLRNDNESGYKGVRKVGNRWRAEIMKDKKCTHLGYFATAKEAAEAYQKAATDLHGEFACW